MTSKGEKIHDDHENVRNNAKRFFPKFKLGGGLNADIFTLIEFISKFSTIIIPLTLLFSSAIYGNKKALFWLFGVVISVFFIGFALFRTLLHRLDESKSREFRRNNSGLSSTAREQGALSARKFLKPGGIAVMKHCDMFGIEGSSYGMTSVPALPSIFHTFTISYLLICLVNGAVVDYTQPVILILTLFLLWILDTFYRNKVGCDSGLAILLGSIIGILGGIGWFFAGESLSKTIYGENDSSLLYFSGQSGEKCRLSQQKFKCEYVEEIDDEDDE
jgi:hypothetical protein